MPNTKDFKVVAISKNTGSFGHKNHILVAQDGTAVQGDRQPNSINKTIPDLKEGQVLSFNVGDDGQPTDWINHRFEFMSPFKDGKAPPMIVKQVWG